MLGAIIIADCIDEAEGTNHSAEPAGQVLWACVDVLGQSVIARVADQLRRESCDAVFVARPDMRKQHGANDAWNGASAHAAELKQEGFETVLIVRCGAYAEVNSAEMLAFHRERGAGLTRSVRSGEPLDWWMIDSSLLLEDQPIQAALRGQEEASYPASGYVNRMESAYDLRRLVLDSFSSRCGLRPHATELRPGIWISEGAHIARSARIVAPSFIGRDVLVSDECLITRGSNVEHDCRIDFGTAVEDSSILPNTYIGIGLDVSHSIVHGSNLLNLRHNVTLQITDPVVMRQHSGRAGDRSWSDIGRQEFALSSAD